MLVEQIESAPANELAAVDSRGNTITYGALRANGRKLADKLGSDRRLVLLEGSNTVDWLTCYAGCLLGRHPVLIAPGGSDSAIADLSVTFSPDVVLRSSSGHDPVFSPRARPKTLHPDLGVMLSTSGSTGSTKCVRLSYGNISANAASICEYLEIGADERGVANLPTHYSYGLSVVNSHLYAGATVLLTDVSVIEPEFWDFLREHDATSFQGVPHTYELLRRIDFVKQAPKSLRYFTQAGGRLDPEKVRDFGDIAQKQGWLFYVMYGQTEATARMAYLPPEQLASHPASIGMAIPGGKFSVQNEEGKPVPRGEVGELVYEGPNVMMGYAASIEQLALDAMPSRLATGDLARVDEEGFYYITGRLSRFVKIFGNRIGLDDVERILSKEGVEAIATGVDDHLLIVTTDTDKHEQIPGLITKLLKLPQQYFSVRVVDEYPRLASGKIDYQTLKSWINTAHHPARSKIRGPLSLFQFRRKEPSKATSVQEVFIEVFGDDARDSTKDFRSLGGDSLTYVTVAMRLESSIGQLPEDWDVRPISELRALEQRLEQDKGVGEKSILSNLDTLRGLACLMVVVFHVVGLPESGLKLTHGFLRWLVDSLVYVRMPLFTAMAGFFYGALPVEREGLWRFSKRRFAMLMLPALCVTPIYWVVRRVVYGSDEALLPGLLHGYLHLWYLYALLVMLVLAGVIETVFKPRIWVWGALALLAPIVRENMPYVDALSVSEAAQLFCFFALGVLLYRIQKLLRKRAVLAVALVFAAIAVTMQQLGMREPDVSVTHWPYWAYIGGASCVLVMLHLVPRVGALEAIGIYSYTIYLWHPMANAGARFVLRYVHVENLGILLFVGILAGVVAPILFHVLMLRFPRMRNLLIGR